MRRLAAMASMLALGLVAPAVTSFGPTVEARFPEPVEVQRGASHTLRSALRTGEVHKVGEPAPEPPKVEEPPAPPAESGLDPLVAEVVALVNAERTARGLAPLVVESRLTLAAQRHSDDMAARTTLTHTGSDGSNPGDRIAATGYLYRAWGENAAYGYSSAASVVAGWMGSAGHRQNILNGTFTETGVAIAYSAGGRPYWTQVFATPR